MQPSDKPRQELRLAQDLVGRLKEASSLVELEEYWRQYLRHLDRVWNKAEAHFSKSPRWNGWQGQYLKQRSKDPLICYLVQARNVEEHAIEEITEKQASSFSVNPAVRGQEVTMSFRTDANGEVINFRSDAPVQIQFSPSRVVLLPVVNRGRTYQPPTSHMGALVDPNDLTALATKGAQFYEEFLCAAEKFFVTSSN